MKTVQNLSLLPQALQSKWKQLFLNENNPEFAFAPSGLIEERGSLPLLEALRMVGDWPVASADWSQTKGNAGPGRAHSELFTEAQKPLPPKQILPFSVSLPKHKSGFSFNTHI